MPSDWIDTIYCEDCCTGMERIPDGSVDLAVMDPYMGSGTTAVACVELGIHYVGFEIEPAYVSVAQRRIDVARLRSRPPQTDLSSFNASADAIQTSSINTRENLS